MKIHREGHIIIFMFTIILLLINILFSYFTDLPMILHSALIFFSIVFLTGIILFFRVPKRVPFTNPEILFSPADGTVVDISKVYENEYFKKEMVKISIFMSIYNVHLNRVPIESKVKYQKYHPGKHLVAFHPKSSEKNEHNTIVFENKNQNEILIRQIAGTIARRIKWYVSIDQSLQHYDELGFIKFGSRVDIFIKPESEILVKPGQKVIAGITPVSYQ